MSAVKVSTIASSLPLPPPTLPPPFAHANEVFICPSIRPFLRLVSSRFNHLLPLHMTSSQLFYFHLSTATSSLSCSLVPPPKTCLLSFFHPFFLHPQLPTDSTHIHTHLTVGLWLPPHPAHTHTHTHLTKVSKTPRCVPPFISISKRATSLDHPSVFLRARLHTAWTFREHLTRTHTHLSKQAGGEKKEKSKKLTVTNDYQTGVSSFCKPKIN